jgi:hypothetical protein
MGLLRKAMSISTIGLIDYRSDKERIARYTRQTRNATRVAAAQNARIRNNQREQLAQAHVHHVEQQTKLPDPHPPYVFAPGWYNYGDGIFRWFDGYQWTPHTR